MGKNDLAIHVHAQCQMLSDPFLYLAVMQGLSRLCPEPFGDNERRASRVERGEGMASRDAIC